MFCSRHCEPFAHSDTYQTIPTKRAKDEAILSGIKSLKDEIAAPITADFYPLRVESGGNGFAMTFSDNLEGGNDASHLVDQLT